MFKDIVDEMLSESIALLGQEIPVSGWTCLLVSIPLRVGRVDYLYEIVSESDVLIYSSSLP